MVIITYTGGHIKGAINIQTPEIVEKLFFTHKNLVYNPSTLEEIKQDFDLMVSDPKNSEQKDENSSETPPILIFHCEFSQQRGPRAFRALRTFDRRRNVFPCLYYPQIYILDGGYHQFHKEFPVSYNWLIWIYIHLRNTAIQKEDTCLWGMKATRKIILLQEKRKSGCGNIGFQLIVCLLLLLLKVFES